MTQLSKETNEKHFQKLIELFKGKLSISNRNYYDNLEKLDNYIKNYKEEIQRNTLEKSSDYKRRYYELHRQKLVGILITYNLVVLNHKIQKYRLAEEDFPKFEDEQLNLLLNTAPSKAVSELTDECLRRHSLILQSQEAFLKYWMHRQKEELQNWLSNQGDQDSPNTDPDDLNEEGLTLNQQLLVANIDGTLAAAEDCYGKNLAQALSRKWKRPPNKIAESLRKLYGPARNLENSVTYQKDTAIAEAFVARYGETQ